MILSQSSSPAQSVPELALDKVGDQLKIFWKNSLSEIISIGNYLESIRQEFLDKYGNKGERFFQKEISEQPHFPIDFAKLCHKISLWYSNLSESHRKFLQRFGWGLSLSCFKELTKLNGELLLEFFSQKERKKIKLKDIRDFLNRKTKIILEQPITLEHWEIVSKHCKLDTETLESLKVELENFDNPTTTELLDILTKHKFKVKQLFKKPSKPSPQVKSESQLLPSENNLRNTGNKFYTESEVQNTIQETIERAKAEFSTITKKQAEESQQKLQEISEELYKLKENYQKLKSENQQLKELLAQKENKDNNQNKRINQTIPNSFLNNKNPHTFPNLNIQTKTRQNKPKGFGNSLPRSR